MLLCPFSSQIRYLKLHSHKRFRTVLVRHGMIPMKCERVPYRAVSYRAGLVETIMPHGTELHGMTRVM